MKITGQIGVLAAFAGVGLLTAGLTAYRRATADPAPSYRFAKLDRGTIHATVSATGTLSATRTVEVGTQASGQIAAMYVDYNDQVKKGQLIARIDPKLEQQAVADAQAGRAKAQAQLTQTRLEYERNKPLHDQKIITDVDFNTAQSNYAVAQANLTSAEIALDKARQNLTYTNIYAPIDGIVVERDMDVGQTVTASLSTPKLFTVATDLARMQILASVDESDIGAIKVGQSATFTVEAYPNRSFTGTVRQVRLNSTTTNNVVNYTAVINIQNPDRTLLPGMTATVTFLTGAADGVLTVPNMALRFQPMGVALPRPSGPGGALWYLDGAGKLAVRPVHAGLTDGLRTQVDGAGLAAGMSVIVGTSQGVSAPGGAAMTNPFQQQNNRRGGGPPGPPGPF
jgi:HlyD family secretion protein